MVHPTISPVIFDWVTAVGTVAKHNSWLRNFLRGQDTKPIFKAYHHSHGVEYYPSGIKHYHSPHEVDKASVIVVDGQALANIRREYGHETCLKFVSILARASSHFSRVDLAVDIFDEGETARYFAREVLADRVDFGRRNVTVMQGQGTRGGTTTYVGSRTSPKYLRFYDKFAESKGVIPSSRLELELKAEAAQGVSSVLNRIGSWRKAAPIFNGTLTEFSDWSCLPVVESLLYGDVEILVKPERERLMSRKDWLTKQVLPTFVKDASGEGGELWAWFKEQVEASSLR